MSIMVVDGNLVGWRCGEYGGCKLLICGGGAKKTHPHVPFYTVKHDSSQSLEQWNFRSNSLITLFFGRKLGHNLSLDWI
ncbi:hypothetical protein CPB84DRAFT_1779190 [Gymnopilus junonius]|uniref:Uncharacterized protein n=1 Tax=Gymnopilus junonius TaxID=109634 RepID=A0A9P5NKG7_GYMJU|nr:hypothetical protein CPB84DRAFT_1779190 [Gymnopilus junonius]